ncbi:putative coatomer subunit beta'-3 [Triticum aestivum]|uniref:putative coatomer subunit beta'-3 n=1 Tax=Triticum aestivum TaxID=4565 RepID=UPI001D01DEBB|nr:putative coatomer subunit beta'-3 [Triticum aestivum]
MQTFEEHSGSINDLKFNPEDTKSFASADSAYTVKVWSVDSPKSKFTLSGHLGGFFCLDFFKRDGQLYLISGSSDKTAKIWDMLKEECVHTLEHESAVISVLSHANLSVLVTGTDDGAVHVWSATDFRLKTILQLGPGSGVVGFACLMGSGRFAVAHERGVSVIQIPDEEEQSGCSNGSNENSISVTD